MPETAPSGAVNEGNAEAPVPPGSDNEVSMEGTLADTPSGCHRLPDGLRLDVAEWKGRLLDQGPFDDDRLGNVGFDDRVLEGVLSNELSEF